MGRPARADFFAFPPFLWRTARSGYRKLSNYPLLLPLANKQTAFVGDVRELVPHPGVQRSEDARNLTSLRARRRSPAVVEQPTGNRRRKKSLFSLAELFCGGV